MVSSKVGVGHSFYLHIPRCIYIITRPSDRLCCTSIASKCTAMSYETMNEMYSLILSLSSLVKAAVTIISNTVAPSIRRKSTYSVSRYAKP